MNFREALNKADTSRISVKKPTPEEQKNDIIRQHHEDIEELKQAFNDLLDVVNTLRDAQKPKSNNTRKTSASNSSKTEETKE